MSVYNPIPNIWNSFDGSGGCYGDGSALATYMTNVSFANCVCVGFNASNDLANSVGGGIFTWGTSVLSLINVSITSSSAKYGGGIYIGPESSVVMSGSTLTLNQAAVSGGGILVIENPSRTNWSITARSDGGGSFLNVSTMRFINNCALGSSVRQGSGAIELFSSGNFWLDQLIFSANTGYPSDILVGDSAQADLANSKFYDCVNGTGTAGPVKDTSLIIVMSSSRSNISSSINDTASILNQRNNSCFSE